MSLEPSALATDLDTLEAVEKATLRMVAQAISDYRESAVEIFANESDLAQDRGEDATREALDRLGTSSIPVRLFGKMDYKRARYLFQPEFSLRQALFVDSKAEDASASGTATIQMAQTSMTVNMVRAGATLSMPGSLPTVIQASGQSLLTTTIFVKYHYRPIPVAVVPTTTVLSPTTSPAPISGPTPAAPIELMRITVFALPSGLLQARYNPSASGAFWRVGRDAPSLGEAFRVRVGLADLKALARWRVQRISVGPTDVFAWDE